MGKKKQSAPLYEIEFLADANSAVEVAPQKHYVNDLGGTAITAFDGSYVDLDWDAPAISSAHYYRIFRSGEIIANVGQGTTEYTDTTVESGETYTYVISYYLS